MIILPIVIPSPTRCGSRRRSEPISLVDSLEEAKRSFVHFYAFCFGLLMCLMLALGLLFKPASNPELPAIMMLVLVYWSLAFVPLLVGEYDYYEDTLRLLCLHEPSSWMLSLDGKQRRHHYGASLAMHWICIAEGIILFFLTRPKETSYPWDEGYLLLSALYLVVVVFMVMGLVIFSCNALEVRRERRRWRKLRDIDPNFQMTFAEYAHAVEPETEKAPAQKNRRHHRGQNH